VSLTYGSGPFGQSPAGRFNVDLPREGLLYLEELPRWVRARFAGEVVVDTRRPRLLHESGRLPVYYFPEEDVRTELLSPSGRTEDDLVKGRREFLTLTAGDRSKEDAAWRFSEDLLAGLVAFEWDAMDEWLEEEERLYGHARDPYSRIDVRQTSRHVRVSLDGEPLAESRRAKVLYEAGLPPRWYFPPGDVRTELLEESDTSTTCAYKGFASYWNVRVGNRFEDDLVWTYREPLQDALEIKDMLAFFNERVDLEVEDEREERPHTQWSRD
jgi:uncharacterized protein (DUF427 family)